MTPIRTVHNFIAVAAISAVLMLSGCATTQASREQGQDAALSKKIEAVCEADCDNQDDSGSRYQYYLGILSVFLMG